MDLEEFEKKKQLLEGISKSLSEAAKNPTQITLKEVIDQRNLAEQLYKLLSSEINKHIEEIEKTIANTDAT